MVDRKMSLQTLLTLAEMHHGFGLIGIDEYEERCRVAWWLYGHAVERSDPREVGSEERERENDEELASGDAAAAVLEGNPNDPADPGYLQLLFNGWIFTKADPDPYPSTPHGHWRSPDSKWPKLDPYNGRVFVAKHCEDMSRRLNRIDMRILWSDERFKDFCRGHLVWYRENFPYHTFRVRPSRLLRLPHW
jgi:hypothetical protein